MINDQEMVFFHANHPVLKNKDPWQIIFNSIYKKHNRSSYLRSKLPAKDPNNPLSIEQALIHFGYWPTYETWEKYRVPLHEKYFSKLEKQFEISIVGQNIALFERRYQQQLLTNELNENKHKDKITHNKKRI